MTKFTSSAILAVLAAGTMLQGCSTSAPATIVRAQPAATAFSNPMIIDPACLATAPWFTNPAEVDLQLIGCRPASAVPALDPTGWREFASTDGALIRVRGGFIEPRSGKVEFHVVYNGGGSLTVNTLVIGVPNAAGVLKAGTFVVKPLN